MYNDRVTDGNLVEIDDMGTLLANMGRENDLLRYQILRELVFKRLIGHRVTISAREPVETIINKINSEYIVYMLGQGSNDIGKRSPRARGTKYIVDDKKLIDRAKSYIDSDYLCTSMAMRLSDKTVEENIADMVDICSIYRGEQVNIDRLSTMSKTLLETLIEVLRDLYGYGNREIGQVTGYSKEHIRNLGGVQTDMSKVNKFFYRMGKKLKTRTKMSMDYIIDYQCGHIFVRESHQSRYFVVLREMDEGQLVKLGKIKDDVLEKVFKIFKKRDAAKKRKDDYEEVICGIEARNYIDDNIVGD